MNITSCPQCGGHVRSVSIGWKCESCQGFIDMRGEFHRHKEDQFMPPMTNGDRIRAMSDEELANTMYSNPIFTVCDAVCKGDCAAIDTLNDTKEDACKRTILEWLQQPAEEDT